MAGTRTTTEAAPSDSTKDSVEPRKGLSGGEVQYNAVVLARKWQRQ